MNWEWEGGPISLGKGRISENYKKGWGIHLTPKSILPFSGDPSVIKLQ